MSATADTPPVAAFPWEINFKVGDLVALEVGTTFCDSVFTGKQITDSHIFLGRYTTDYTLRVGGRTDYLEDWLVFKSLIEDKMKIPFKAGRFFVRSYFDEDTSSLKVSLCFNATVFGRSLEEIKQSIGWQNQMKFEGQI